MTEDQASKAALVTGGAKRVGRAIVEDLAAHGWAVAIHYRQSAETANALADDIVAAGGRAAGVAANLSDEREVTSLTSRAADSLGQPLTLLVNSASTFERDTVETADRRSWDLHIEPNSEGAAGVEPSIYPTVAGRRSPATSSTLSTNGSGT